MWIPLGAALVFTYAVVAVLGWWRPVLRDDRPVRRWVWVVPITFASAVWRPSTTPHSADKTAGYVLALLVATQFVGWGEEGMFRGIGVTTLRSHGLTEGKVALWSSVIFGAVHLSNAFTPASQAVPQALAVSFAGYFFYLIRRVAAATSSTRSCTACSTSRFLSGSAILADQGGYVGSLAPIAVYPVLALILFVRRRRIEPAVRVWPVWVHPAGGRVGTVR